MQVAKHFELDITETAFAYHRKADAIAAEAALDGLYIVRTSVPATELDAEHMRITRALGMQVRITL